MFGIMRLPFLHPFPHVIRHIAFSTSYVKLPLDHALTNHCFLCSFRNWWEEICALPILLHTLPAFSILRKREDPLQGGWGWLVRTAFLRSHSAGSHTCMLGPHCALCSQVSRAKRFFSAVGSQMTCQWLLVLGRWEKRMTNTDICPPMEMEGGWPKHSSELVPKLSSKPMFFSAGPQAWYEGPTLHLSSFALEMLIGSVLEMRLENWTFCLN